MMYRPRPPAVDAYQFHKDWDGDQRNWPGWLHMAYKANELVKISSQRVIAVVGKKAIFEEDYAYITDEGIQVEPPHIFEMKFEAVA